MRVVDLFSGPGGLTTGFESFFNVEAAVDHSLDACATYKWNHNDTRVYCQKVENMTFGKHDFDGVMGVIGGPPCQSHSELNQKKRPDDPRTLLMIVMVEAIADIRPQFCLIENVARIPPFWKRFAENYLAERGYKVVSRVIRAWDYGSVQLRRRWILTGCLDHAVFPEPREGHRVAQEILTGAPSEFKPRPETLVAIQKIPAGKWVAIPGQTFKVYYVIDPAKPLPAVVNPSKLRYVRPDRTGYLSMAELYHAAGFPQRYKFFGNLTSRGQQLADAVPVEMAEAFAQAFHARLN